MRLLYIGPVFKDSGYGVAATLNCVALHRAGINLRILPTDPKAMLNPDPRYKELVDLHVGPQVLTASGWTHIIIHAVPSELKTVAEKATKGPETKLYAYTTWESDPLPGNYSHDIASRFDEVMVPSVWNQCLFREAQILFHDVPHRPVHVVPHPFDPDWWWAPEQASAPSTAGRHTTSTYRFYTVLTWNERKNPLGLLKAYFHAFSSQDDVELIIVTPSWSVEDVQTLLKGMRISDPPKVTMRGVINADGRLSEEEYRQLHYDCDCYVSTTRGEAWGLGMFEAALVGNPVIAPAHGGQVDFLSPAYSIRGQFTPVVYPETPGNEVLIGNLKIKTLTRNVHEGACGDQLWFESDLIQTSRLMRMAYDNHWVKLQEHEQRLQSFTLEAVGQKFKEVLQ